jgi:hypothetical protein
MFVQRAEHKYKVLRMDDTTAVLQNRYGAEFEEPIQTLIACDYILVLEEGEIPPLEWPETVRDRESSETELENHEIPEDRDAEFAETATENDQKTQTAVGDADSGSLRHQEVAEKVSGDGAAESVVPEPEKPEPVVPEPDAQSGSVNLFDF